MIEKAYKLLALQEGISNKKAKELIDKGIVSVNGKKLILAREEFGTHVKFKIQDIIKPKIIFENDDLIVVDKPAFLNASDVEKLYSKAVLLNRLDKETSGVMMLAKNNDFRQKAIEEFKKNRVYKEYVAVVEGKVIDEITIDKPIYTIKKNGVAKSKIDSKRGKPAITHIYPFMVEGNKSKIKIVIEHGRTHQIRVHLRDAGFPIIGDLVYGKGSNQVNRVMLHSKITRILGFEFYAKEPKEFFHFGLKN